MRAVSVSWNCRSCSGQGAIGLMIVVAAFIILPLGALAFEFLRFIVLQQELRSVCDASALAGCAALASCKTDANDPNSIANAQAAAMAVALEYFRRNSIADIPLANTQGLYNNPAPSQCPALHQAIINIELLDAQGNIAPLGSGAATLKLQAWYGDRPMFGPAINVNQAVIYAEAVGGVPTLDFVLCFDVSGSMDDETPVTFVRRFWDGSQVQYVIPQSSNQSGQGIIYNVLGPPTNGSALNALAPQNLAAGSYFGANGNATPFLFSESAQSSFPGNHMFGLRANLKYGQIAAGSEVGCPPGNFDPNNPASQLGNGINPFYDASGFTDLVVNLDGKQTFGGWTSPDGYAFPNVATLVEAARGNLDLTPAQLQVSQGNSAANLASLLPPPRPGYQQAYFKQASKLVMPMRYALEAAANFISDMHAGADGKMGLVAFSDSIGSGPTSTWSSTNLPGTTANAVDANWPAGGTNPAPLPLIHLGDTVQPYPDNYTSVLNYLQQLRPAGKTDIADSIAAALQDLTSSRHRAGARRAIVLFTDGIPNAPGSGVGGAASPAAQAAYQQAQLCQQAGIPIYTIALALNPNLQPVQNAVLGDNAVIPPPAPGQGIAAISGGTYVSIINERDLLTKAFQSVQRGLVSLR